MEKKIVLVQVFWEADTEKRSWVSEIHLGSSENNNKTEEMRRGREGDVLYTRFITQLASTGHLELNSVRKLWNGTKHLTQNRLISLCRGVRELEYLHTISNELKQAFQWEDSVNFLGCSDYYLGERHFLVLRKKEKNSSGTEKFIGEQ